MRLIIAVFLVLMTFPLGAEDGGMKEGLAGLDWLAGKWIMQNGTTTVEEWWMEPSGGAMLGLSRTVRDGKMGAFEYLRIDQTDKGLAYLASPQGHPATPFYLRSIEAQKVTFENPEHDFPQRIVYWRSGDRLCARIEGEKDGKPRQAEWCWSRVE